MDSLFLGTALASSSTVIIAKVLFDFGKLKDTSALIMLGILVVEDLFVVALLAVITSIAGMDTAGVSGLTWDVVMIIGFIFGTLILGSLIIPKIIDRIAKIGVGEVLIITALGLCFGLSIIANLLGLSMAQ